jgi:hypothetical protein
VTNCAEARFMQLCLHMNVSTEVLYVFRDLSNVTRDVHVRRM